MFITYTVFGEDSPFDPILTNNCSKGVPQPPPSYFWQILKLTPFYAVIFKLLWIFCWSLLSANGLGPGGLDIWDPFVKGILMNGVPDPNPKPPGPKPPIYQAQ